MSSTSPVTESPGSQGTAPYFSGTRWPLDLAYLAFTVVLFAEVFFGGARFIDRDLLHFFYPLGKLLSAAYGAQGSLLWDTSIDHGMPLAARWSAAVFYPAHWLFALLRADVAVAAAILIHFPVAACSMLRLALRYTESVPAAWLGGLSFAFGGYLLSVVGGATYFYGAALLPLSMLALHRLAERPTLGRILQLAAVLALQIFNPDPQTLYFEALICGPLLLWLRVPRGRRLQALGAAAAAGALALSLCWCQLWPAAEVAELSVRAGGMSHAEATLWSLHPGRLVEWLIPGAFGGFSPHNTYWAAWLSAGPAPRPWATSIHVGLLALIGLFALRRLDRRAAWAWGGLSALFLLLALGRWTPLYQLVLALPGADSFRYPEKHVLFVTLGLALLGAIGLGRLLAALRGGERLRAAPRRALLAAATIAGLLGSLRLLAGIEREQLEAWISSKGSSVAGAEAAATTLAALDRALVVAVALLALLALRRRIRQRLFVVLLLGVAATDLLLAGLPLRVLGGGDWLTREPPVCAAIPAAKSGLKPLIWRNATMAYHGDPPGIRGPLSAAERHRRWERFTGKANVAAAYCARYAFGYTAASLASHRELVRALEQDPHRLADVLGVRHLIDRPGRLPPSYPLRAHYPQWSMAIHDNADGLPYAHGVGRVVRANDRDRALARIADRAFDFRREVIFEGALGLRSYADAPRRTVVRQHRGGAMAIAVDFEEAGYLLLLESYYPGWKARIDGEALPIYRANAAFIGLAIPRGRHQLELIFAPARQRSATWISLGGSLAFLALIGVAIWRHRRRLV